MFITFEGPEGSGKSTQIKLLTVALSELGYSVVATREPGGTPIGTSIRSILLDPTNTEMDFRAEALLYFAARAQLVEQVIRPALGAGRVVLCDRYVDSSYAYQGYGRAQSIEQLRQLAQFATDRLLPDLTFYLDIEPALGIQRKQGEEWNRFEAQALAFHETVRAGYWELIAAEPERWLVIDASRSIEAIHKELVERTATRLAQR